MFTVAREVRRVVILRPIPSAPRGLQPGLQHRRRRGSRAGRWPPPAAGPSRPPGRTAAQAPRPLLDAIRRARGGGEARGRPASQRVDDAPRSVLVVEDDRVTRAFLVENLIADGFHAVGAAGAGEGLRAIEVRQPSLVVLDLSLEDGSGLSLLDRVRASDGLSSRVDPELPVIVLSGRAGDADRVRSFD